MMSPIESKLTLVATQLAAVTPNFSRIPAKLAAWPLRRQCGRAKRDRRKSGD